MPDTATALAAPGQEAPVEGATATLVPPPLAPAPEPRAEGATATLVPPPLAPAPEPPAADGLVVEELLVEDVSIDGMCGVY